MAFIFSDLVVLPILRINAEYYGWKMAFYILGLLLTCLICTSLLLHYGFVMLDLLPANTLGKKIAEREMFTFDYGFVFNLIFLAVSALLTWFWWQKRNEDHQHDHGDSETSTTDQVLRVLSLIAILWLTGGLLVKTIIS
jgi:hypothetical protein